ncbi:LegC family aminotransferase [Pseudoalteromonas maricaloris]|uniref:LegC family aminotransferase n=1 Tax=Pseudoalteromonas maricaloris TaxID=184924 RepID=A0A8I2H793_9GAMM|nr:LegC family aminotransferase [Pseudoalteromonas maricaloris]NLR23410.1 LegC family aminotransferase [Pseudoalteromonas maricaloris]WOX29211.1 LegC family aminotransferase [Pseudoalteromonas maricaloris]
MDCNCFVDFVRDTYSTNEFIPLHAPTFSGNENKYVKETIDSTFVSSVGKFVDDFEKQVEAYTRSSRAVATVNGTAALHTALHMAGVRANDIVVTQALTFVATCNALHHMGAEPAFVDISPVSLGLCPKALAEFLEQYAEVTGQGTVLKSTKQRIKAVVPMHTFGHPVELEELMLVCQNWRLPLIEDAAESLGSFYKGQHTGTFGEYGAISFNGNKVITTGGGGMVLCKTLDSGAHTKHLTTTAKVPHPYEFFHDEAGFNYRMPNLNAALGCAQMEALPMFIENKRQLAQVYRDFFNDSDFTFVTEPEYAQSNYWLNAIICPNPQVREKMLKETNENGVMTRPIWQLMHRLPMYKDCLRGNLTYSEFIESHLINIPSSPIKKLIGV